MQAEPARQLHGLVPAGVVRQDYVVDQVAGDLGAGPLKRPDGIVSRKNHGDGVTFEQTASLSMNARSQSR